MSWADTRRPVPRLWIRSAEGVGAGGTTLGEWEYTVTTSYVSSFSKLF